MKSKQNLSCRISIQRAIKTMLIISKMKEGPKQFLMNL